MKLPHIFLIGLLSAAMIACDQSPDNLGGVDVTSDFLSQYNGEYKEQIEDNSEQGEGLKVSRDGSIEVTKVRQVGSEDNPAIPYPTVCSFILKGQIRYVLELYRENRQRINPSNNETYFIPATHEMTFTVESAELTNSLHSETTSSQGCQNFIEQMNNTLPNYSYQMELFGSGTLRLHTHGGGDYNGGERTESTLDEVFMRQ